MTHIDVVAWALCGVMLALPAIAPAAEPVAWVEHVTPTPRSDQLWLKIVRGGEAVQSGVTEPYTYLQRGDELRAYEPFTVVVQSVTGERRTLSHDDAKPYVVGTEKASKTSRNLMHWLGEVLLPHTAGPPQIVSMSSRGAAAPLALPLLDGPTQTIDASPRGLYLAWQAGAAPYALSLGREDGTAITELRGLQGRDLWLGQPLLAPGKYDLKVRDARGQEVTARFIVAAGVTTTLPAELAASQVDGSAREAMEALWLAQSGEGERRFEAFQRLVPLTAESTPARTWVAKWSSPG